MDHGASLPRIRCLGQLAFSCFTLAQFVHSSEPHGASSMLLTLQEVDPEGPISKKWQQLAGGKRSATTGSEPSDHNIPEG